MSMTYKEHLGLWTTHAERIFADFKAVLSKHDGVSVLDWKNKYGAGDYYMRVIFDEDKERMFISGDLGNAVFQFTEKATLFSIAKYSSFPYFFSKLSCTTDRWKYDYDSAKEELKERLIWEDMIESELDEADELIGDIMDNYDQYGNGSYLTEELRERLSEVDPEYFRWVSSLGRLPHPRVIIWWQALKLAARQIQSKEEKHGQHF